ncbi:MULTISPECIES: ABC transporter permease [unclassified Ruminococcus]|uniref:ABC transporter permease n=1 Tax=unclassified Ruminococcus TaxID=2608920 RepID=UPI0021094462|nr:MULTISPECIES: FtsX-like permease family protein [unclassified Ruminococcus]MCQ4022894.1 FtsX-like permease family protein [Ruminococcus sp. zg-924]MCQ4115290.1 FtsX-like permease family protein [Ruminococcus sp. zg-921]
MRALRLMPLVKSSVKNSRARTAVFFIFILFCITCILLTTSIILPMGYNMEFKVNQHPYNLELTAELSKGDTVERNVEELKKIPHVVDVYKAPQTIRVFDADGKMNLSFFLSYFHNGYIPEITYGRNVNEGEKNTAVMPEFVKMNDPETQLSIEFDCKTLVGQVLKLSDENQNTYELNIVGTFNVTDPALDTEEIILDVEQLNAYQTNVNNDRNTEPYCVIIDNYRNMNSVQSACDNIAEYSYTNSFKIDLNNFNMSMIVLLIVLTVFLAMVVIGTSVFVSNCVSSRTRELALYRSLGYRYSHIFIIIFTEYLLMLIAATIASVLISFAAATIFINPYLDKTIGGGIMSMQVQLDFLSIALVFCAFLLIITIICVNATRRTERIPLAVLLRER